MRTVPFGVILILFGGGLLFGACSGPPTLQTYSPSEPPVVDGTLSEWDGALRRVGDSPVSMSVAPTDSLLYITVLIPDRKLLRSVVKHGLIVWVDPAGQRAHTYGVQYPIALQAQRPAQKSDAATEEPGKSSPLDQLFPSDLALIRNDTIRRRMPARLASGLQVHATMETGDLIYELAIPVSDTKKGGEADASDFGLHASLGPTLTVGLETPSEDDSKLQGRQRGIPSVTGRGRGRRGRTPRGRRRGRRGRQQAASTQTPSVPTLDLWAKVVTVQR
ncbi:MAG: hypothetical protein ABEL51_02365 [Salinibacter sp.]